MLTQVIHLLIVKSSYTSADNHDVNDVNIIRTIHHQMKGTNKKVCV